MGIPDSFYWFAINGAAPDSFHVMTTAEITPPGVTTPTTSKVARWQLYQWLTHIVIQ